MLLFMAKRRTRTATALVTALITFALSLLHAHPVQDRHGGLPIVENYPDPQRASTTTLADGISMLLILTSFPVRHCHPRVLELRQRQQPRLLTSLLLLETGTSRVCGHGPLRVLRLLGSAAHPHVLPDRNKGASTLRSSSSYYFRGISSSCWSPSSVSSAQQERLLSRLTSWSLQQAGFYHVQVLAFVFFIPSATKHYVPGIPGSQTHTQEASTAGSVILAGILLEMGSTDDPHWVLPEVSVKACLGHDPLGHRHHLRCGYTPGLKPT